MTFAIPCVVHGVIFFGLHPRRPFGPCFAPPLSPTRKRSVQRSGQRIVGVGHGDDVAEKPCTDAKRAVRHIWHSICLVFWYVWLSCPIALTFLRRGCFLCLVRHQVAPIDLITFYLMGWSWYEEAWRQEVEKQRSDFRFVTGRVRDLRLPVRFAYMLYRACKSYLTDVRILAYSAHTAFPRNVAPASLSSNVWGGILSASILRNSAFKG